MEFKEAYWCAHPGMVKDGSDRIAASIAESAKAAGVTTKPIVFTLRDRTDPECPPVPDWMPEDADPRLLVGTTVAHSVDVTPAQASFLTSLSDKELTHLRNITQSVAMRHGEGPHTDEELDSIIAACGHRAAEAMLSQKIEGRMN